MGGTGADHAAGRVAAAVPCPGAGATRPSRVAQRRLQHTQHRGTSMSATTGDRIAVVIPALNEERAIRGVVESVLALCPNVIVIDDGSTDHTIERIADLPVTLIRHATPLGKGQGLRDGFRKARELGFDAV